MLFRSCAVHDLDLVAHGDIVGGVEREYLACAVIHAKRDAVARNLLHVLFNFVTGNRAADGARHRGKILAATAADLVPDDAADHAAGDGAATAGLALLGDA